MTKNEIKPDMAQEKDQYFYLHYGQPVFKVDMLSKLQTKPHAEILDDDYLLLTPLSQITDEDAIEVATIILGDQLGVYRNTEVIRNFAITGFPYISIQHKHLKHRLQIDCTLVNFNVIEMDEDVSSQIDMKPCDCIDFLRSKGYALPWKSYSVDQQIEMGWIKLKGDSNHE